MCIAFAQRPSAARPVSAHLRDFGVQGLKAPDTDTGPPTTDQSGQICWARSLVIAMMMNMEGRRGIELRNVEPSSSELVRPWIDSREGGVRVDGWLAGRLQDMAGERERGCPAKRGMRKANDERLLFSKRVETRLNGHDDDRPSRGVGRQPFANTTCCAPLANAEWLRRGEVYIQAVQGAARDEDVLLCC